MVLFEAIDEGLKAVVGESGKEAVYYHFQNFHGLEKKGIPGNPEVFIEFLSEFFGLGAKVIENTIFEKLCLKLGIKHEEVENLELTDFIKEIVGKKLKKC